MEIESEIESKSKNPGWYGESMRHRLAAKGISTAKKGDWRLAKVKALAEEEDLTWQKFKMIYGDSAEERLEEMINSGSIELEGDELEEGQRLWKNQTLLEINDDGETKKVVIDNNTPITCLGD